jgi:hypothetical protein
MPATDSAATQYQKKLEPERANAPPRNIIHLKTRSQIGCARLEQAIRNSRLMVFSMSRSLERINDPSSPMRPERDEAALCRVCSYNSSGLEVENVADACLDPNAVKRPACRAHTVTVTVV